MRLAQDGFVKLHRVLLEKAIWTTSTPEQKVILIALLLMANHKENEWEWKGKKFKAVPGQFVTSLESIRKTCGKGISTRNVRTALERFKKYEFLTYEATNTGRLITILNWCEYQANKKQSDKASDKRPTNDRQTTDKRLTTNKNDKNDKNDKKYIKESGGSNARAREETIRCYEYYQQNVGLLNGTILEQINSYLDDGITDDLICAAIDEAVMSNKRNWRYINGILNRCASEGVKTVEQFRLKQAEYTEQKSRRPIRDKPDRYVLPFPEVSGE